MMGNFSHTTNGNTSMAGVLATLFRRNMGVYRIAHKSCAYQAWYCKQRAKPERQAGNGFNTTSHERAYCCVALVRQNIKIAMLTNVQRCHIMNGPPELCSRSSFDIEYQVHTTASLHLHRRIHTNTFKEPTSKPTCTAVPSISVGLGEVGSYAQI